MAGSLAFAAAAGNLAQMDSQPPDSDSVEEPAAEEPAAEEPAAEEPDASAPNPSAAELLLLPVVLPPPWHSAGQLDFAGWCHLGGALPADPDSDSLWHSDSAEGHSGSSAGLDSFLYQQLQWQQAEPEK